MSHQNPSSAKQTQDEQIEHVGHSSSEDRPHTDGHKHPNALDLIEEAGGSTILTPENNSRVLRKIDLRLLPILLAVYFLQQVDKSTLSYASVFGLIEDVGLKGQEYSWLGSVIYLAQLICQPLVAYILVKVPIGKFLALTTFLWGVALSCMTPSNTFAKLLVCRIFLGIFEAGIREFLCSCVVCCMITLMFVQRPHSLPLLRCGTVDLNSLCVLVRGMR